MGFFRTLKNIGATAVGLANPGLGAAMVGRKQISNIRTKKRERQAAEQTEYEKQMGAVGPQDIEQIRKGIKVPGVDGGFTETMRSQMLPVLQGQQEQQRRQLLAAQARAGVRGGASAAQAGRMALQQGQQRALAEQDIFAREQYMKQAAELAKEQMAFQELGSRRAAMSSIAAAQAAQRKK